MEPLKSLYNDWEVSTEDGAGLFLEVHAALRPIIDRMVEQGYRVREVAGVMHSVVGVLESETCLLRNHAAYKRGERPFHDQGNGTNHSVGGCPECSEVEPL